ncbi:MAG TPA: chloride channel protein [Vicinamibacterales bacterium]|jgi:CIC family chloride channel protein|nr:chloride channel protein [Vicinamibacterales bacterium]
MNAPRKAFLAARMAIGDEQLLLLAAILIGVYAGLAVVCFRLAIQWLRLMLLGSSLNPSFPRIAVVPAASGLVIAAFVVLAFPAVRGSGVNQTKAALYIYDGYISFRTVIGKFLTSAVAIGSGQSLGPEDPSLQIGAGLASALGRWLKLPRDQMRYIAPIGAAAGLAAAFNSPITAVLFVIEEVIGRWTAGVLGAVVLSAVASVVTEQWFLGDEPLFRVPPYHLAHGAELLAYAALGLIGGLVSLVFVKSVAALRPRLRALPPWTWYLQPAVAGLFVGFVGLRFPQVMGAGYEFIDQAMHDQYGWRVLLALGVLKVVTTTASFVSGTPGGLFAPTLFIGAMLGGAVCAIERLVAPGITGPIGAYALVGMGTLFAGIIRAPMTSVFMIVEVSGNYSIILPVMISNTIAYLVSRQFQEHALFDVLARQEGTVLPSMEEERESDVETVEDAMRDVTGVTLSGDESLAAGIARAEQVPAAGFFLVDLGAGVWGGLSRSELDHLQAISAHDVLLRTIAAPLALPYLYPDQSTVTALRVLHGRPFIPVVHRADRTRLEGMLALEDVLRAMARAERIK